MSLIDYAFTPSGRPPGAAPHAIGIVLFDQFSLLQAVEVADVFEKANRLDAHAPAPHYKTTYLSASVSHADSSLRIAVLTQKLPEPTASRRGFRALFVAGGDGADEAARDPRLLAWLRDASAAADTVSAIGEGNAILHAARAPQPDAVRGASILPAVEIALDT